MSDADTSPVFNARWARMVMQNAGLTPRSNFDAIRDEITGALDSAGVEAARLYALGDYLAVEVWESPEDYGGCDDDPEPSGDPEPPLHLPPRGVK